MGQNPQKDEGPAQQAPEEGATPDDLEPLSGYANQTKRRAQLFELNGYFRMRTDYMHQFSLGQGYSNRASLDLYNGAKQASTGLPPFPTSIDCPSPTVMGGIPGPCNHKDLAGANIRFRLEPTLNVTDNVRIHSQFDVLDNTILGSTPDSLAGLNRPYSDVVPQAPIPFLYNSQDPPEVGQNGYVSSIRAKRAWAEIDTEFGSLRFGRMPWHFGRGISYNDGSCLDCDGGTTVDRLALLTEVYGHQFTLAMDYGSQGLTSNQLALGRYSSDGTPIDLAQDDDVYEFMAAVTHIDNPTQLREKVDRGEVVLNYGLQLVYRSQHSAYDTSSCGTTGGASAGCMTSTMPNSNLAVDPISTKEQALPLQDINAYFFQPNLWAKLHYRALVVEFEGTALLGKMDRGGVLLAAGDQEKPAYFRQFGAVLASELHLYRDAFFVGFEAGGASGDQAENDAGYLNYRWRFAQQPAGDHSIRDFKFSPEYHVDSILFRYILGTVTNAIYFKPAVSYWFDLTQGRQLGVSGSIIYSMAQVPVSTPGNALGYGLEMNASATYRNTAEGFYAGMTWGVLWPFAALNRPSALWQEGSGAGDASAAQVLRGFLGVKF
jgi:uncharacterized protein (TIGR04551 family)